MNRGISSLLKHRLIVFVGSGGVGKTTTAAALGVAAARAGKRTAVITVDPARRLKDALGLDALCVRPRRVSIPGCDAVLDALALDAKRTFDALVERAAPNEEIAARILANRLYQDLSNGLGGSAEYMAMEKLHELLHAYRYDLVIVDTPPGAHASELLSAPVRLIELLASGAVGILKAPTTIIGGAKTGVARTTLRLILKALQRWTGIDVLNEVSMFINDFEHLIEGFRSRAAEIERELRAGSSSFVLVTGAEPDMIAATLELYEGLKAAHFPVSGVVANRVHRFEALPTGAGDHYPATLRRKLLSNYAELAALSRRDAASLALLTHARLPTLAELPVFENPPTSMDGLIHFADRLTGGSKSRDYSSNNASSLLSGLRLRRLRPTLGD